MKNPFADVKVALAARLANLKARREVLDQEIAIATDSLKMAEAVEAEHEKRSPSKPRGAAKPAKAPK